jgi:hypothetical protein
MTQSKFIRIKMTTWKELRHFFPAERGETASHYIERFVDRTIVESERGD